MILPPRLVAEILAGRKTQFRRLTGVGRVYAVGRRYSITDRAATPPFATIEITAVREEPLGALSPEDARAEGFRDATEFFADWCARLDVPLIRLNFHATVRVYSFRLLTDAEQDAEDDRVEARSQRLHDRLRHPKEKPTGP